MKTLTINTEIQFDQFDDSDSEKYAIGTINALNEVLQQRFSDICPIIFTENIRTCDIEIEDDEEEEDE